jgi:hypothetical protein
MGIRRERHVLFIDIVGYSKLLINEQSDIAFRKRDLELKIGLASVDM